MVREKNTERLSLYLAGRITQHLAAFFSFLGAECFSGSYQRLQTISSSIFFLVVTFFVEEEIVANRQLVTSRRCAQKKPGEKRIIWK